MSFSKAQGETRWRSLRFFSYYRLVVAAVFLTTGYLFMPQRVFGEEAPQLYFIACWGYLFVALALLFALSHAPRSLAGQLTVQVVSDVFFLVAIQYTSGGIKSGVAMLLLVALTGASLVGEGRLALFYAALATLALLGEHGYRVINGKGEAGDFLFVGLTSLTFFGMSIAAWLLARRISQQAELARLRGIELAEQERINERVIRDMQDGVLVVDREGRVRSANPQAARLLLGADDGRIIGERLEKLAPALARVYDERREMGLEYESVLAIHRTGRTLRARFLPPSGGNMALFFLEDASRRQQLMQQAKLAALGRLTANLAHEIRNPLAAISQAAELLGEDLGAAESGRLIRIIGDNARRIDRLVGEIRGLGERDRARPEQILLRPLLAQVIDELVLSQQLDRERIVLAVEDSAAVCFDRSHLHRVAMNLIDNALRHASERAGAVRVYCEKGHHPQRIALHVVDDGPGIGEAEGKRIFEPFFTTRKNGMGLGLYIARELAEANGARLFLLENSPGAHFCLSCVALCPETEAQA